MNCQEHTDKQADLVLIVSFLTVLKFITTCRSLNQIQEPKAVSQVIFRLPSKAKPYPDNINSKRVQIRLTTPTLKRRRELLEVLGQMEECISELRNWMSRNMLKLNDDKTEFIILETDVSLTKVKTESIKVGNHEINPVECVRNIGAIV